MRLKGSPERDESWDSKIPDALTCLYPGWPKRLVRPKRVIVLLLSLAAVGKNLRPPLFLGTDAGVISCP